MLNLLVCRLVRGIDVEQTSKLILEMLRPKLLNLAVRVLRQAPGVPMEVAYKDLQSAAIELLQHRYKMGEVAFPLHYLFGAPHGAMYLFAHNYGKTEGAYEKTFVTSGASPEEVQGADPTTPSSTDPHAEDDAESETNVTRTARAVIADGSTLSALEYRVMAFTLSASDDGEKSSRAQRYLAEQLGVSLIRVAKVYEQASAKVRIRTLEIISSANR